MKKKYVKPLVYFESFELSSSIAGTCVLKTNHDVGTCGYKDPTVPGGAILFTRGEVSACTESPQGNDSNKLCYQGVNGQLFTS